ncbi:MAG: lipid A deacylase LpxR family protein [Lentisphaeria bacterium]
MTLGNIFTHAGLGSEARLGFNIPDDFGTSLIRPGANLSSPMNPAETLSDFGVHVFLGAEGRAVLQNIFLDGNTWKDSHSVDKKHFVADLYAGLALTYRRFRLVYTHAYRTREFDNQDNGQEFGSVNLSYAF